MGTGYPGKKTGKGIGGGINKETANQTAQDAVHAHESHVNPHPQYAVPPDHGLEDHTDVGDLSGAVTDQGLKYDGDLWVPGTFGGGGGGGAGQDLPSHKSYNVSHLAGCITFSSTTVNVGTNANATRYIPFIIGKPVKIVALSWFAASTITILHRVGIYSNAFNSSGMPRPQHRLVQTDAFDNGGSSGEAKEVLSTPLVIDEPGLYWAALAKANSSTNVRGIELSSLNNILGYDPVGASWSHRATLNRNGTGTTLDLELDPETTGFAVFGNCPAVGYDIEVPD